MCTFLLVGGSVQSSSSLHHMQLADHCSSKDIWALLLQDYSIKKRLTFKTVKKT